MTVSRVLREPERVSPKTRENVARCIRELQYRPNPMVSVLMSSRRRGTEGADAGFVFLITIPASGMKKNPAYQKIFEGAAERANAKGYLLTVYSTADEKARRHRLAEVLRARGVVGVIVGPLASPRGHLAFPLDEFASVACGFSLLQPKLHRVATNQSEVSAQVFRQAFRKGHRRIGLAITHSATQRVDHFWQAAFLYHQQKLSVKNRVPILVHSPGDLEGFGRWLEEWRPDCVIGSHVEHLHWLKKLGLSAPGDIGFAALSCHLHSNLVSGAARDFESIGCAAVDLLSAQLHDNERGIPQRRQTVLLDPKWIEGTTL